MPLAISTFIDPKPCGQIIYFDLESLTQIPLQARCPGYHDSVIVTKTIEFNAVAAPKITPEPHEFDPNVSRQVELTCATPDVTVMWLLSEGEETLQTTQPFPRTAVLSTGFGLKLIPHLDGTPGIEVKQMKTGSRCV